MAQRAGAQGPGSPTVIKVDLTQGGEKEGAGGKGVKAKGVSKWLFGGLLFVAFVLWYIENKPAGTWDARQNNPKEWHTSTYYLKCAIAGSFACASHVLLIPLDVVKVNMQYDPEKYRTLRQSLLSIAAEYGWGTGGLLKGAHCLIFSFGKQGVVKFGLYEFLKDSFMNYVGKAAAIQHLSFIFLFAACVAELYADLALCPWEMLKVRIQTAPPGSFPTGFFAATARFWKERHENGFPWGSIEAVWSRQIPYTMAKFFVFETLVRTFYTLVFTAPKESYPPSTQLFVTVASGFLTGLVAAFVSHIPDTLFSLKAKPANAAKPYSQIIREVGLWRLATVGLVMRMIIVGCLTAIQWWTYDTMKQFMGLQTTSTLLKADPTAVPATYAPL